jgi:hypothetical protein
MKGYKVFNSDWTCGGFKYEVGETYEHKGDISICKGGFHFCREIAKCFNYYDFNPKNKVAEIEALGNVESDDDKSVTDKIKIVREISWEEMLRLANSGEGNTGIENCGNWNSGNCNSGNRNSGNCNSGNWNSGNWNSGDWNSGNRNSGNWNSGNCNSGLFNTKDATVRLFNKNTKYKYDTIANCKGMQVLNWNYENNWWIYSNNMTEVEKKEHPEYETLGGYLKVIPYKDACKLMWDKLDDDEKQAVKDIPYFDDDVFKEITGIDVNEEDNNG